MRYWSAFFLFAIFLFAFIAYPQDKKSPADSQQVTNTIPDSLSFLPPGAEIASIRGNRVSCFLPKNMEVNGILCHGDTHHGWMVAFYLNGQLALAFPAKDVTVQGIPCKKATFWTEFFRKTCAIKFHENGKLAQCRLARDFEIQGKKFKKGTLLRFDKNGKLISK